MDLPNMCYVLLSCAGTLTGQVFICCYIFMTFYNFTPPFREAIFCEVSSCIFDKLRHAAGEEGLRNSLLI
jgi:hypothetical protein